MIQIRFMYILTIHTFFRQYLTYYNNYFCLTRIFDQRCYILHLKIDLGLVVRSVLYNMECVNDTINFVFIISVIPSVIHTKV